jgi:hypothetical protein
MIDDLLDACAHVLECDGNPLSPGWFVSQMEEMRLWRANEDEVRRALLANIKKYGKSSRFMRVAEDEFALRAWADTCGLKEYQPQARKAKRIHSERRAPDSPSQAFPAVAKWVQSYGWIEIGEQPQFGFVVRALDDGGLIWESQDCCTLDTAMMALEAALQQWFAEQGRAF